VRQLIKLRAGVTPRFGLETFGVGRCNQPKFAVQNAEQIVEIAGTILIPGCFQQFRVGSHVTFDVAANLR
jgi:hypothetical protein